MMPDAPLGISTAPVMDPLVVLRAIAIAAPIAMVAVLLFGWPWRQPSGRRLCAGGALGVGVAFAVGVLLLGLAPKFPPRDDQDRFVLILIPAAVIAEVVAASLGERSWLAWLPRFIVAASAARILLHNSIYISDSGGTPEWSATQIWLILGSLTAALICTWMLLDLLAMRAAPRSVVLCLALAIGGAAFTIMLSGYATGGQLGIPLAAVVLSAALASLVIAAPDPRGIIGVGIVGSFGLLVIGRFFGYLTTTNAVLLFCAPLVGWLAELPYICRLGPRWRGGLRVGFSTIPAAVALVFALQSFHAASTPSGDAAGSREPSIEDYLNFGK